MPCSKPLSHPVRRKILVMLRNVRFRQAIIAAAFDMAWPITAHLTALKEAGLGRRAAGDIHPLSAGDVVAEKAAAFLMDLMAPAKPPGAAERREDIAMSQDRKNVAFDPHRRSGRLLLWSCQGRRRLLLDRFGTDRALSPCISICMAARMAGRSPCPVDGRRGGGRRHPADPI